MRLSDQVWVMRAGRCVGGRRTAETTGEEIVSLITGARRPVRQLLPTTEEDHHDDHHDQPHRRARPRLGRRHHPASVEHAIARRRRPASTCSNCRCTTPPTSTSQPPATPCWRQPASASPARAASPSTPTSPATTPPSSRAARSCCTSRCRSPTSSAAPTSPAPSTAPWASTAPAHRRRRRNVVTVLHGLAQEAGSDHDARPGDLQPVRDQRHQHRARRAPARRRHRGATTSSFTSTLTT